MNFTFLSTASRVKLSLVLFGSLLAFSSCRKDDEGTPVAQPVRIDKDITTATTLAKVTPAGQVDYVVTDEISIFADVTIQPGVTIVFKQGTDFTITTDGSLNATGTSSQKITFKGEQNTTGYWGGLYFKVDDLNNKIIYCSVENAGADDHTIPARKGAVIIYNNARATIQNSTLIKSGGYALIIYKDAILDNAQSNIYKESALAPVHATATTFKYLDGSSDYTGNTKDFIDSNESPEITGTHNWKKLNVPYRFENERIDISGNITIEAGAKFIGQQGSGIRIKTGGSFKAIGTAQDSVYFRGEQNTTGYWGGFQFTSNSSENKFEYVVISDAGGANSFVIPARKANIEVSATGKLSVTKSIIKNSAGAGIRVMSGGNLTHADNSYYSNTDGNFF